jgi:hypothetical protein
MKFSKEENVKPPVRAGNEKNCGLFGREKSNDTLHVSLWVCKMFIERSIAVSGI